VARRVKWNGQSKEARTASIRAVLALLWIALWIGLGSAAGVTAARSQSPEAQQNLDRDIRRMSDCYHPLNHGCVVDFLDPEFVVLGGGHDEVVKAIISAVNEMSQHDFNIRLEQTQFDKPGVITPFGGVLIAKMTTYLPAIVRGQAGTVQGTILAVSRDGGKSWRFVEATRATRPDLEARFSGVWERLAIPNSRFVPQ
jgi:hypothetical protein